MSNVRVSISGLGKDFVRRQMQTVKELAETQIEEMARQTAITMKRIIAERIEREGSTGNLEEAITAFPITNGWGVGDIDFLNKQVPYWYWQNFGVAQSGRSIPPSTTEFPKNRGSFAGNAPSSGGGSDRWEKGIYPIYPKQAIEAKNYIEATINEINQIIASVIRR